MYNQRQWTFPVSGYICTSRRQPVALTMVDKDAFAKYVHGGWAWGKLDYAGNLYFFENRPNVKNMASITDGLSNTLMVGEKAFNPAQELPNGWYYDEPFFLGGSKGTSRGGFALLPDGPALTFHFMENWGSSHDGVVLFLAGDGAVHSLAMSIDPDLISDLLTPDGGEPASIP